MQDSDTFKHRTLQYRAAIEQLFQSGPRWISAKARIENQLEALGQMLPEELVLSRKVIAASDIQSIRAALKAAIRLGCHPGVRSCYDPQIPHSPWVMNLRSEQDIDHFLDTIYPDWFNQGPLTEVVVMFNPPELGLEKFQPDHFVFRLGISSKSVTIEARLKTAQLRDLDDLNSLDLIHINIAANTVNYQDLKLRIGGSYTLDGETIELELTLREFLYQPHTLKQLMLPQHADLIIDLVDRVLRSLKSDQLHLEEPLSAFSDQGMEYSEWQGRQNHQNHVRWMKIYGFRGSKDDTSWLTSR